MKPLILAILSVLAILLLFILNILAILAILLRFLLFAADASTPRAGISLACDLPRRDIREGA